MKLKKYIRTSLIAGAACLFTACGDFLEEVSQDQFEPKTIASYQELLNGAAYGIHSTWESVSDFMSDDVNGVSGAWAYSYSDKYIAYKEIFSWQPHIFSTLEDISDESTWENYQRLYQLIMTCNLVINGLDNVEGTETEYNQTMGEALALRGFYYFMLVNYYALPYNYSGSTPAQMAGVPIVIEPEIKDEGIARNTVEEVYAQITADLESACSYLEKANQQNVGVYRIGTAGAHLIASRVYLYMEQWDKVIAHVGKALETAPELCDLNSYVFSNSYNPANSNNEVISKNFPETIFISGAKSYTSLTEGTPYAVSTDLINLYETGNDKRKTAFFYENTWVYYRYWMAKYGTAEQAYVWRTAELYLNRAEAYAQKYQAGDASAATAAAADLNKLRANRLATPDTYSAASADELLTFCREERRRELCFEKHRWFDLRRWGMPSIQHTYIDANGVRSTYTLQQGDLGYVWPIPESAIELNSELKQNELPPVRTATTE